MMTDTRRASAGRIHVFSSTLLACATVGCAFGSVRTVNGATFELSGAETVLAERMEAQDPRTAPMEVRCGYWRQRRAELNASHQELTQRAGVVGTTYYDSLRTWAEQHAQMACSAAADNMSKAETARRQQAEREEAERAAAQKAAEVKAAADALRAYQGTCGDPTVSEALCVQAATRACQLGHDAEPCAVVAKVKEERAKAQALERAERERKLALERAEQEKLIAQRTVECDKRKAESCYELGDKLGQGIAFLKRSCELKYGAGCIAYAAAVLEQERARKSADARKAARDAARQVEAARQARGPTRSLQNPADVQALQQATQAYKQCLVSCVQEVQQCIGRAPSFGKPQWVDANCNPPYNACQDKCEVAMNREGWCLSHDLAGRVSGGAAPCP